MKWRREINYHGSRVYAPDPDPSAFAFNRMMAWGRRQFERVFQAVFRAPIRSPAPLEEDGFYSLLGASRKGGVTVRAKACPFPQGGSGEGRIVRTKNQANDQ